MRLVTGAKNLVVKKMKRTEDWIPKNMPMARKRPSNNSAINGQEREPRPGKKYIYITFLKARVGHVRYMFVSRS